MPDMSLPTVSCTRTSVLAQPPQPHPTHVELGAASDGVSGNNCAKVNAVANTITNDGVSGNNRAKVNALANTTAAAPSYRRQLFCGH